MKRKAGALVLLAALGGCMSADKMQQTGGSNPGNFGGVNRARTAPGYQGPWGEPVNQTTARPNQTKSTVVQTGAKQQPGDSGVVNADFKGGTMNTSATGGITQTSLRGANGPGVPPPGPPGAVAAIGALPGVPTGGMIGAGGGGMPPGATLGRSSIRFTGPSGMKVAWLACTPDVKGFTPAMVEAPGRYNFPQGGVYRLKLTDIPNRPSLELYPTLEVRPASARTTTFLAHSAVPVSFTEEDFEQVNAGNFVIKVIYLPDPQYQDLAVGGPDEVVSSRLEPGVDPILEAERRGAVLCVIRIGNIDLEAPNTPPLGMPPVGPNGPFGGMPLMGAPGGSGIPAGALPPGATPVPNGLPPGATPVPNNLPPGATPVPNNLPPGATPVPNGLPPGATPVPNNLPSSVNITPNAPATVAPPLATPPAVPAPTTPAVPKAPAVPATAPTAPAAPGVPSALRLPDLPGSNLPKVPPIAVEGPVTGIK